MLHADMSCQPLDSATWRNKQGLMQDSGQIRVISFHATQWIEDVRITIQVLTLPLQIQEHVGSHRKKGMGTQEFASADAFQSGYQEEQNVVHADIAVEVGGLARAAILRCFG